MGHLDVLSEALIDTLKELSAGKRKITATALKEAFSARDDILPLLRPESANRAEKQLPAPNNRPARVALPKMESLKVANGALPGMKNTSPSIQHAANGSENRGSQGILRPGREVNRSSLPESETLELLPELRNLLTKLLDSLGPVIMGNYESRFCELQKNINECQSIPPMWLLVEQIGKLLTESISQAIEKMEYSNDFLVELGKDLCKMEDQFSAYQNYNLEISQKSNEFHNNLLSHTDELHRAFTSGKSQNDIFKLISSKLGTISKAIEIKKQSDTVQLQEADAKIANLQQNLRTYNQEIIEVTKRAESLEKVALLDGLTRINNRRAYDLQIRECLRRYHRGGETFSLILMDIDHFKRINDDYGHKAGDKCLQEVAQIIKSSLRKSDFLARYGGEELIAVLYGSNSADALNVAEKIRSNIERTRFHYQDKIIHVTISSGVTEILPDDGDPEIPFVRVDKAMYQAKKDGRNRICAAI